MKVRVFKNGESVIYNTVNPTSKYNIEDAPIPEVAKDLPYFIADSSEIPPSNSQTGDYHEMIYIDGEFKKENLKQDKEWNVMLMPEFIIGNKHKANLTSKMDIELDKQVPDPVKIMSWQRQREKVSGWTMLECYEQALANLDEKVQKGEPDKPIIRAKLKAKIKEINEGINDA